MSLPLPPQTVTVPGLVECRYCLCPPTRRSRRQPSSSRSRTTSRTFINAMVTTGCNSRRHAYACSDCRTRGWSGQVVGPYSVRKNFVRTRGLEPPPPFEDRDLNPARLPFRHVRRCPPAHRSPSPSRAQLNSGAALILSAAIRGPADSRVASPSHLSAGPLSRPGRIRLI